MVLSILSGKFSLIGKAVSIAGALAGAGLDLAGAGGSSAGENRLALWYLVHGICVPNQQTRQTPAPCVSVDLSHGEDAGSVVLKDRVGATQYLLIPTQKITGIESPVLLEPGTTNYWSAAWNARLDILHGQKPGVRREFVGLAINSTFGRSQDQLHIHVDCIERDVFYQLKHNLRQIGATWAPLTTRLAGQRYEAMRVLGEDLTAVDPFKLLGERVKAQKREMGPETLAVIGATFETGKPGFILLADHANPAIGDMAHSEELLDHACAILKAPPQL